MSGATAGSRRTASSSSPIATILELLTERGCDPKETGSQQWSARCPAHSDREPSLSVSIGDDDRVLLACHTGCATEDIVATLGTTMAALFTRDPSRNGQTGGAKTKRKIVATYDYCDEKGKILYQVVRFRPKGFSQRRPDGNGHWAWGLSAGMYVRGTDGDWRKAKSGETRGERRRFPEQGRVLYRQQEINRLGANTTIYICEGEKDCDRLWEVGLAATTCPQGAGKWSRLTDDSVLRGRTIVILNDNDDHGRSHTQDVARRLHGRVVTVRILELPGLGEHEDVSDWLDAGHDPEELDRLAAQAPTSEPSFDDDNEQSASPETSSTEFAPFVPLTDWAAPDMPPNLIGGPLGDQAVAVQEASETPLALSVLTGLAVLSTVAQRRYIVGLPGGHCEPVNVYVAPIASSGERKSGVQKMMTAPLVRWERQRREAMHSDIEEAKSRQSTYDARIKSLRQKAARAKQAEFDRLQAEIEELEKERQNVPRAPRVFTSDCTSEQLATLLADNDEHLAVLSDEGGIFATAGGRYSGGIANLDIYLQAWSGSFVRVDRGSKPSITLDHPTLTIGLCVQPEVIREVFARSEFVGRGLVSRFFWWWCNSELGRRKHETKPVSTDVKQSYEHAIFSLLDRPRNDRHESGRYVLIPEPKAEGMLLEFVRHALEPLLVQDGPLGSPDSLRSWGSKMTGGVYRLAGLLHCNRYAVDENEPPERHRIAVEEAATAIELAHLLIAHAQAVFIGDQTDPTRLLACRIWRWILSKGHDQFRERDCFSACRNRQVSTMADFIPALDLLCEHGHLARTYPAPGTQGGRQSVVFVVNPEALKFERDSANGTNGQPRDEPVSGGFARSAQRSPEVCV